MFPDKHTEEGGPVIQKRERGFAPLDVQNTQRPRGVTTMMPRDRRCSTLPQVDDEMFLERHDGVEAASQAVQPDRRKWIGHDCQADQIARQRLDVLTQGVPSLTGKDGIAAGRVVAIRTWNTTPQDPAAAMWKEDGAAELGKGVGVPGVTIARVSRAGRPVQ